MKNILSLAAFMFMYSNVFSQDIEMATTFMSSGKIYVVVAVVAIIMLGLIIYLFSIDSRLKKLERKD